MILEASELQSYQNVSTCSRNPQLSGVSVIDTEMISSAQAVHLVL